MAFVTWGLLHGVYQILEAGFGLTVNKIKQVFHIKREFKTFTNKFLKMILTFALTCFAYVFFRANNLYDAAKVLHNANLKNWLDVFNQSIYSVAISREYWQVTLFAILVLAFVDYEKYRGRDVLASFFRQNWWFRMSAEVGLLVYIILFGCYGNIYDVQQFIYFQF